MQNLKLIWIIKISPFELQEVLWHQKKLTKLLKKSYEINTFD